MKQFTCFFIFILISLAAFAQTDTITILHINDTHSNLAPLGPRGDDLKGTHGGIARAATVIGMTKMTEPNVLTLHDGDIFSGDLFFNKYYGVAELRIMNQLGFDAMAVGNHEFDLGPGTLLTALDSSYMQFPLLSANLLMDSIPALQNYIKSYTIKTFGNTKIGIFGLTTPDANTFSFPSPLVIDTGWAARAYEVVSYLSGQGCNVIICLSHLGRFYDMGLAAGIPGISIIVSGHDHYRMDVPLEITNPVGGTTYIVQGDAYFKSIGRMKIAVNGNQMTKLSYEMVDLDNTIPEEPMVAAVVQDLITDIEATWGIPFYSQQAAVATDFFEETVDSVFYPGVEYDTPVGNLVTEAFRWIGQTQIAIQVSGSTSQPIYKGKLTPADIFRVFGYGYNLTDGLGYHLAKFRLKGSDLLMGLEIGLANIEYVDDLVPQVDGMGYCFDANRPANGRVTAAWVGDQPLNPDSIYTVTGNEFLAGALAAFGLNIIDLTVIDTLTEFSALMNYIAHLGGVITPEYKGNVTGIKDVPAAAPTGYELDQNYPNPFNPETVIRYRVAGDANNTSAERIRLTVYDVLGNEVTLLVNEEKSAGTYEVRFDGRNFSSGIYFCELRAGGVRKVMKMNLLK